MFALSWQYLTGRAVATDPANRQEPEWPPHPDRVFQALVAAWGETGREADRGAALDWLCSQPPPSLAFPENVQLCAVPTVYVPVNDIEGPNRGEYAQDKHDRLLPEKRARKERWFPAVFVGDGICSLIWPDADACGHCGALAALCAEVTRIGHSSSLIRMWLDETPPEPAWIPSTSQERRYDLHLRVAGPERLRQLVSAFADGGEAWARPPASGWRGYVRQRPHVQTPQSVFDPRLIVLRRTAGERSFALAGAQVLNLADALRRSLIAAAEAAGSATAKAILSGHAADGAPAETPHAAYLPLPAVGHEHADGHLLGLAVALPRNLSRTDEDACFLALAKALRPEDDSLRLVCGQNGSLTVVYENRHDALRPWALRPETWCRPARRWGTVTPVVLDRLPPRRHADADSWAAGQIAAACTRIGLPIPCGIRILPMSPLRGVPAAREYTPLRRKSDDARRWHVHAELQFSVAVHGPVLLGAGRYRGYGLCKPMAESLAVADAAGPEAHTGGGQ